MIFEFLGMLLQESGLFIFDLGKQSVLKQVIWLIGFLGTLLALFVWIRKKSIGAIQGRDDKISDLNQTLKSYKISNRELSDEKETLENQLKSNSIEYISIEINEDIKDSNIERAVEKTAEVTNDFRLYFEDAIPFAASFYVGCSLDNEKNLRKAVFFTKLAELLAFNNDEKNKHRKTSELLVNLAVSLKKEWRLNDSAELLDIHSELEGVYTFSNFNAISQRQVDAYDRGDFLISEMMARRLIVMSRRVGSIENQLVSEEALADSLRALGEYENVKEILEPLLESRIRILGDEHPDTLYTRHCIAVNTAHLGNQMKSNELFQEVFKDQSRILGADHPDTLQTHHSLAIKAIELGDRKKAKEIFNEVLEAKLRVLGMDDLSTLATRKSQAQNFNGMGDFIQANNLYEKLIEDHSRILDKKHPDTLNLLHAQADNLMDMEKYEMARDLYEEIIEDQIEVLGMYHPETLSTRQAQAINFTSLGEFDKAEDICSEVLKGQIRSLGKDHYMTLSIRFAQASNFSHMEEFDRARELFEELVKDYIRVFGRDYQDTMRVRQAQALNFAKLHQIDQARNLFIGLHKDMVRIFGKDHPDTLNVEKIIEDLSEKDCSDQLE